ncbi:hypothetical protein CYPRO_2189 [Cyclonatronum proteinivorum]|uniref:Uncharacterized protein n=1 Tax=Cyclonatronum proteinivorum TaxID=1457365 RepID=A0A345ULT5_9BACT|nr:hypothetical protein CYPRO_2189 [Cyclonatronum proteinivorum]
MSLGFKEDTYFREIETEGLLHGWGSFRYRPPSPHHRILRLRLRFATAALRRTAALPTSPARQAAPLDPRRPCHPERSAAESKDLVVQGFGALIHIGGEQPQGISHMMLRWAFGAVRVAGALIAVLLCPGVRDDFFLDDLLSPVTRHPSPVTRHPSPVF